MQYTRFIALGDSMTEGMTDEVIDGKFRGWADRVADVIAKSNPSFTYMNLAIRGKLLKQVVDDQIPAALKYVEGKQTLVSFHAGANDVLRPNYNPVVSFAEYEKGVKQLTDAGATVILFTVIDKVEGKGKTAALWHQRFSNFNENVRMVAAKYPSILFEAKKFLNFIENKNTNHKLLSFLIESGKKSLTKFAKSRIQAILAKMRMAKVITPEHFEAEVATALNWER